MRTVSVVIPCYNEARHLRETLDSALGQSVLPAEVIVIDDGSADESASIAEAYGPPVRVIRQENRGMSAARNRGIEVASGGWIAFLDADDRWEPEKLERQIAAVQEAERTREEGEDLPVCVYTDLYRFRGQDLLKVDRRPEHHRAPDWHVLMLCEWVVQPSTALVRADTLECVRFPEDSRDSEDTVFFLDLRRKGPFLRVPEPLVGYRVSPASQSRQNWHLARSVETRWQWFLAHSHLYDDEEARRVRTKLAEQLKMPHNNALWTWRDPALVRACRRLYAEIHPEPSQMPESFERRVWPRWLYRLKDSVFERLNRTA